MKEVKDVPASQQLRREKPVSESKASRSQYCANHLNADPAYVPLQSPKNKNKSLNKRQATTRKAVEPEKCQTTIEEEIGKEKKTE